MAPPVDETPSHAEVRQAAMNFRDREAARIWNISAKMLKAKGEAMIYGLQAVLPAVWQSGAIVFDWIIIFFALI